MARIPPEIPEVEIDPALLIELETTGSFTSPVWRPAPPSQLALPPPPRLPALPSLPSLPPPRWMPSLPPLPSLPRSTLPPARALPSEATRPDVRPQQNRERTSDGAPSPSVPAAVWSVPPAARRSVVGKPARAAGLGVAAGVTLFVGAWLVATPSTAAAPARALITVTDSRGIAQRSVHVFVDGLLSCEAAPCSVELEPGAHQIDVVNLLTDQRAGRSLSVSKAERAALHFALPLESGPARVASPAPPAPASDEPISVTALAQEPLDDMPETPTRPQPAPVAPPSRGAFLNLNSIPISNVVLDGRPVGSTPLVGLSVSPGTHSVTFVHPEHGRRGASIEVGSGERKAVVVRFKKKGRALEE